MADKKIVKQLMACGVQRNDAHAFIRAYRKLDGERKGKFPNLDHLVSPIQPVAFQVVNYEPYRIAAKITVGDMQMAYLRENPNDLHERVTETIASRLAEELVKSGAVKIDTEKVRYGVEFTGTVMLLKNNL